MISVTTPAVQSTAAPAAVLPPSTTARYPFGPAAWPALLSAHPHPNAASLPRVTESANAAQVAESARSSFRPLFDERREKSMTIA